MYIPMMGFQQSKGEKNKNNQVGKTRDTKESDLIKPVDAKTNTVNLKPSSTFDTKYTVTIPTPHVEFTREVIRDIESIVDLVSDEIGFFGLVESDMETLQFKVTRIFVPPQEVAGAEVDIDDEGLHKLLIEIMENHPEMDLNQMRFYGHSHVNMGTTPSGTDVKQLEEFAEGVDDFFISAIANKKGQMRVDIQIKPYQILAKDVAWSIEPMPNDEKWLSWRQELLNKVNRHHQSVVYYADEGYWRNYHRHHRWGVWQNDELEDDLLLTGDTDGLQMQMNFGTEFKQPKSYEHVWSIYKKMVPSNEDKELALRAIAAVCQNIPPKELFSMLVEYLPLMSELSVDHNLNLLNPIADFDKKKLQTLLRNSKNWPEGRKPSQMNQNVLGRIFAFYRYSWALDMIDLPETVSGKNINHDKTLPAFLLVQRITAFGNLFEGVISTDELHSILLT